MRHHTPQLLRHGGGGTARDRSGYGGCNRPQLLRSDCGAGATGVIKPDSRISDGNTRFDVASADNENADADHYMGAR